MLLCWHNAQFLLVLQTAVMVRIESEFGVGAGRALQSSLDIPLTIGCDRRHTRDVIKNFRNKN